MWALYASYTWTAQPGGSTLQVARFYVPALGAISLLGAWLVTRLPRRETLPAVSALACAAVVAAMFGIGVASFHQMVGSPFGGARIIRACPGPAAHPRSQVRCRVPAAGPGGRPIPARALSGT